VFVECWDNISTGYGVPKGISNLYLWSEQQLRDFYNFNSMSSTKSFVSGGYRISHAKNYLKIKSKIDKDYQSDTLKILYLQGYFYENLNFAIAKIISSIMAVKSKNRVFPNIKIIVRKYPLKRQSIQKEIGLKYQNLNTNLDQEFLEVSNSNNISIDIDLSEADLVISELTTAGLEAAFRKIPVIFVGSNSSIRFLDSMAGYNYSFAKDIPLLFNLINLSKETDLELLKKLIYSLIFLNDETYNLKSKLLLNDSDLELFGKPFELNLWYKLIN
jgi:hypothetical protein